MISNSNANETKMPTMNKTVRMITIVWLNSLKKKKKSKLRIRFSKKNKIQNTKKVTLNFILVRLLSIE